MKYDDIQRQFDSVISYSQCIPNPQTDELFKRWLDAKSEFIKAFGDSLIYEVPVKIHFSLDDEEKKHRLNEFIDVIDTTFENTCLADFLDNNIEGFYDNTVSVEYNKNGIKVPKGMKLIKAFKFFESDKQTLEIIQNRASQVIQEDKIEGTLCFSVHPLDFLSVSENTYNWRSCHALDGEYRAGNLSYMVDSTTFICYLKGEENVNIPMFPDDIKWNSKKWRVLMYLSDDRNMMFAGRQYPFSSKAGLNEVKGHLEKIFCESGSSVLSDWNNYCVAPADADYEIEYTYIPVAGELVKIEDFVKDGEYSLQFNDLLRSTTYLRPYYLFKQIDTPFGMLLKYNKYKDSKPFFTIGGKVSCLECGNTIITNPETMRCDECELDSGYEENDTYTSCDCCGARILRDDATVVMIEGSSISDHVCEDCFRTECFICNECDEIRYNMEKLFDKRYGDYVCRECYNDRREKSWQ